MFRDLKNNKQAIVIIGGGAAGIATALELAQRGYLVTIFEKSELGSGASGRNPGRMGHGFHYADKDTAIAYLRASVLVQRTYPGYLLDQDKPFDSKLRHGRYFITKNSDQPKEKILETYEAIKQEYKRLIDEDPANEVFGPVESFYRILDPSEYFHEVNMDIVELGIETSEHIFNWMAFLADIRKRLIQHPNIKLCEFTEVTKIERNGLGQSRFTIEAKTSKGYQIYLETNYIVNSTWHEIKRLNDQIGLRMIPGERTNRLKTLLVLNLPPSLEHSNSMFFCMGQHCMISNLGGRRAMATYARVTNLETSSGLTMSAHAERLLNGGATEQEKLYIARKMVEGISHYIPQVANAIIIDLKFGIVQTKGDLTLSDLRDPSHPFNKRADHYITTEQIGVISNPCMKLFYFIDNARIVADLIKEHFHADTVIMSCMQLVAKKSIQHRIEFNPKIERLVLENLERYSPSKLVKEDIEKIVNNILNTLKSRASLNTFFPIHKKHSMPFAYPSESMVLDTLIERTQPTI